MVQEQLSDRHKRSGAGIVNLLARVKPDELDDFTEEEWMALPKERYFLEVHHKKEGAVNRIELSSKKWVVVGRQWDNDICVNHTTVSRRHAVIGFRADSGCYLYDLGSTHGTYVNDGLPLVRDGRIESNRYKRIHIGSRIVFGRCAYQYKLAVEGSEGDLAIKRASELMKAQQLHALSSRLKAGV